MVGGAEEEARGVVGWPLGWATDMQIPGGLGLTAHLFGAVSQPWALEPRDCGVKVHSNSEFGQE